MLKSSKEMENDVPEQDEDEDEIDVLAREIAGEVEDAFANVPYPGDERLVRSPTYWENEEILEAFRGKHWRDISVKVLFEHRYSLGALSPEAYRFYLPSYLVAGLIHSDETDTLWQNVFYSLTPPESEGDSMDWFLARIGPLDARQKAAVRRYVELYVQIEHTYPDLDRDRALAFWRRITDPGSCPFA
jgi:hypothetical protein